MVAPDGVGRGGGDAARSRCGCAISLSWRQRRRLRHRVTRVRAEALARLSSNVEDYVAICKLFVQRLLRRAYSIKVIRAAEAQVSYSLR